MTIDRVLVSHLPGETRVALMDQGRLIEVMVSWSDHGSVVGNIYVGRVERVLPGIQAAFLDIGLERSGFLALAETRPVGAAGGGDDISDYLGEGDGVMVQVLDDPRADKGAKLSTHFTVPGHYLVHTPGQPGIKMSRRMEPGPGRQRLAEIMEKLAADDEGFILRTVAGDAGSDDLERDIAYLRGLWAGIGERRAAATPPACLYRELSPLHRVLRDLAGPDLQAIVIDDAGELAEVREFCRRVAPRIVDRLELHEDARPLFEAHGVEEQIEAALAPRVALPSGGGIVIEETTALTAVDVNTGGRVEDGGPEETALNTNLEAAAEIARQVRLRNIGGLVAIDFVPMRRRDNGALVLRRLREAVAGDHSLVNVAGFTRLGLVELTRQRRRESLSMTMLAACAACSGGGRVRSPAGLAFEALRAVMGEARATRGAALTLCAAPAVIEALEGTAKEALEAVEGRLGRQLALEADPSFPEERIEVNASPGEDGGNG